MHKDAIRSDLMSKRRELAPEWVEAKSRDAQDRIMALPEFRTASVICAYFSMPGEVVTEQILEACWQMDKRVTAVAYCDASAVYAPAWFEKGDGRVRKGAMSVPEPAHKSWATLADIDFVIVPGVGFDAEGGRLGHGGGHYDRMLAASNSALTVGLCFDFQLVDRIPVEAHDVPLDIVVTDKRVIRCRSDS